MKRIPHILICVLTVLVTACSEEVTPTYTVGEANNAITLRAGISTQTHLTRAVEDNHTQHTNFTPGCAQAVLRMDGKLRTYKDGKPQTDKDGNPQTDWWRLCTTATMNDFVVDTDRKHNVVTMKPVLYWDDFHTADPDNSVGRNDGLEIYGASVNGYRNAGGSIGTLPDGTDDTRNNLKALRTSSFDDWKQLRWTLPTDQSDGTTITNNDLLTSNNITAGGDGTLKFDDVKGKTSTPPTKPSDLLEFTHAMTHITVELTAGTGFEASVGYTQFATTPSVTLLGFPYVGLVDIINKETTATDKNFTVVRTPATGNINCFAKLNKTANTSNHTATATALVYPGCAFDDATNVLRIMADGNEYLVTAKKMNEAMTTAGHAKFQQGTNYVFQITVNKTSVDVTATIKEWNEITATGTGSIQFVPDVTTTGTIADALKAGGMDIYKNSAVQDFTDVSTTVTWDNVNGSWNYAPTIYWAGQGDASYFRALSPSGAGTAMEQGKDVLWGYAADDAGSAYRAKVGTGEEQKITPRTGHVPLLFEHAMTKVTIKLSTAADAAAKVDFDGATLALTWLSTEGTLSKVDGTITPATLTKNAYTKAHAATGSAVFTLPITNGEIFIPQTITDDARLILTLKDGTTYSLQLNLCKDNSKNPIGAWASGKHYIYDITVAKEAITFRAVVKNWVEAKGNGNANLDWD